MEINTDVLSRLLRLSLKYTPISSIAVDIFDELKKSNNLTNEKIDKAYQSLKDTSTLIDDLQKDLIEKTEMVSKLKEDYEHYSKLSEIEKENIKPILIELSKTVDKGKGRERWISFAINIIAGILLFILGVWLSPKITKRLSPEKPNQQIEQTINP